MGEVGFVEGLNEEINGVGPHMEKYQEVRR